MIRLGCFGTDACNNIDKENRNKGNMDKQNKSLLCMYVDDFCGIKEESFNFTVKRRYMISKDVLSRKVDEENADFPDDFWGDNVSALTLLIGENGAGKTTLMRLLIQWLCQLSAGHFPQEKGALVINVGDEDKLIAFAGGKPWEKLHSDESINCIENINDTDEIKKLLSDIRLAYYTDTMTDLELNDTLTPEELEFVQDDSLLTRLSNSIKNKYSLDSIKDSIKREDFRRQMELFLNIRSKNSNEPDFPIRYMKFTALKAGDKKGFKGIPDGNDSLIGEAIELWKKVFADDSNNNLPDIARELLWGLFSGSIASLLGWEKTLPYMTESIVTERVRSSLREYIRIEYSDWNAVFKNFFKNLFSDCERVFNHHRHYEAFRDAWSQQVQGDIEVFLNTLNDIKSGEFLGKWKLSANIQNMWEFELKNFDEKDAGDKKDENKYSSLLQNWKDLWKHYLTVAHLMPECRFDWRYPSSGEINKANLYCTIHVNDIDICKNVWFLLDEPDNTFHPDWKRKTIQELLDTCSIYKICNINFQMIISTHSPIMLSDVPKQAAILLKISSKKENDNKIYNAGKKEQTSPKSTPFGQQIYTLFNDAFFMKHGVIGAFANNKISETYSLLVEFEKYLRRNKVCENKLDEYKEKLENREYIIKLIDEPLLRGHLMQCYNWCIKRSKERDLLIKNKKETT